MHYLKDFRLKFKASFNIPYVLHDSRSQFSPLNHISKSR